MHVLDFLRGYAPDLRAGAVEVEYRLLCSGELFNANTSPSELAKTPHARLICETPFTLLGVPNSLSDYPQELALRFSVPYITEQKSFATLMHYPDADIARDIAALLSLCLRRLMTVATKVRHRYSDGDTGMSEIFRDCPAPVVNSFNPVHWERKPLTFLHRVNEPVEIVDYNPPPRGVDPEHLSELLLGLARTPSAECVVTSARLYALALTQLEHDVDLAYRSLIEAVEAAATEIYPDFRPSDAHMLHVKQPVALRAMELGLPEAQAKELAIKACQGMPWAKQKFIRFLTEHCTEDLWTADTLFRLPAEFVPERADFEKALGQIYDARSGSTHTGKGFPASAGFGLGPTISVEAAASMAWGKKAFPPAAWFERVVNNAFRSFMSRSLNVS